MIKMSDGKIIWLAKRFQCISTSHTHGAYTLLMAIKLSEWFQLNCNERKTEQLLNSIKWL